MNDLSAKIRRRFRAMRQKAGLYVAQQIGPKQHNENTNIYHCCIQKSGSQWIKQLLSDPLVYRYTGLRAHTPKKDLIAVGQRKELDTGFPDNTIVTPLYVPYAQFAKMPKPDLYKAFWVMRDPRDIVVSRYYSLRFTHALTYDGIADRRAELERMSESEGFSALIEAIETHPYDRISYTVLDEWMNARNDSNVLLVKYEDLTGPGSQEEFRRIFDFCRIGMPEDDLNALLDRYSFEKLSGRRAGNEDQHSHYRKGKAGDWRNHFSEEHKAAFKRVTGDLLVRLGYEKDNGW